MASGCIVSGVGIGAFIFGLLTTFFVNPDNEKALKIEVQSGIFENYFPVSVNQRVPLMFKYVIVLWIIQLSFALLTVTEYKNTNE